MFAKNILKKATHHFQQLDHQRSVTLDDLDIQIITHYGIPSTSAVLAFDHIQRLLAIGTLDGRIKVIGGDNIEGLLIAPKQVPYKYLEFLQNQGYLISISNENDIQVWDLESRCITCSLQWESNITAFSVIDRSHFMYIGDEYGLMSVLKYEAEDVQIFHLPYNLSANSLCEAAKIPTQNHQPIVGVLPQPCSSGNRVLIAYQNGLIILWDVLESRVITIRGDKDLQLKDGDTDNLSEVDANLEEKEITALCWASSDGSLLAVGYIDGDVLLWNMSPSNASSKGKDDVVKLQLSSAERRLPVIVIHWSMDNKSSNNLDGQLFIYGGDEIGSDEVLTVLSLKWSLGMDSLNSVDRVDLALIGSFADMILLPTEGIIGHNQNSDLFVLTSPGQLHTYDEASLSVIISQQDVRPAITSMKFPVLIPTTDPNMTVSKLCLLNENSSKSLMKIVSVMKDDLKLAQARSAKWPLTGGVPSPLSFIKNKEIEKVYIAGYQDGSVRIWDATYPVFSFICILEGKIEGIEVPGSTSMVTKLDFCCITLNLAVGSECGLIRVYDLNGGLHDSKFHHVTESKREVHIIPRGRGSQIIAAFSLLESPIETLKFSHDGLKLAVGFGCGRVAVLDINLLAVRFLTDHVSSPQFPVISVIWGTHIHNHGHIESGQSHTSKNAEERMFILTKDAKVSIIDGDNGKMICYRQVQLKKESIAISMYFIEVSILVPGIPTEQDANSMNEPMHESESVGNSSDKTKHQSSTETDPVESLPGSFLLLCCEDALYFYSTKFAIQAKNKAVRKIKLEKPCCWTTTFKKNEKVCGLVLLYETGVVEIRSFPYLEVVKESSLMSILRWNFKANMDRSLSSDNGQIALANGCEMACISLLAGKRNPEALPCLHDKVLAAATDAAINFSAKQGKKQIIAPGIIGGIVKGFKGGKGNHLQDPSVPSSSDYTHLESAFLKSPFSDPIPAITDEDVAELNIDDIDIDGPIYAEPTSSHKIKYDKKAEKANEREKLFEGATSDAEPRIRTKEEIIAKYRKSGDQSSSAAAQARNKLVERQEKLEKVRQRTEELQSGAEDFASLANELAKTMENRKWWKI